MATIIWDTTLHGIDMPGLATITRRSASLLLYGSYIAPDYYVFDDRQLVYLSIPKVACTSIKNTLIAPDASVARHSRQMAVHSDGEQFHRHRLGRQESRYFKFSFVRNPFDRLVSCYEDKVRTPVQHDGRYFFATGYNRLLIQLIFADRFRPEMTFPEFVRLVTRIPDALSDAHFKSQYSILFRRGRCVVDFVGRFESIENDWLVLARRFGLRPLAQSNRSARDAFTVYYTDLEIVELVARRYALDLASFGYQDEYKRLRDFALMAGRR